jgi:hypothetical protein
MITGRRTSGGVARALLALALVAALLARLPLAAAQYVPLNCERPGRNGDCDLYGISLVQLLANPDKYDGKYVRVTGYVHFEAQANALYLHREDVEHHLLKNGVWVALAEGVSFDACQDAYVILEGLFRARNTDNARYWSGALTRVAKCQKVP